MTDAAIAHALVHRRNPTSPVALLGELRDSLGPDGYATALSRRWLLPDYDQGGIVVNDAPSILEEIRQLAAQHEETLTKLAPKQGSNVYRLYATNQSTAVIHETKNGLFQFESEDPDIGDQVEIGEEGKTFTGTVKSRESDGSYTLSFGEVKPRADRKYKKEELKKMGTPSSPTSTTKLPVSGTLANPAPI